MFPINDDAPQINGRPFINYGLIAINVIIFIYEMIITSNFSNKLAQFVLFTNYGAIPNLILSGQNLPSLFSSMFMHGSIALMYLILCVNHLRMCFQVLNLDFLILASLIK